MADRIERIEVNLLPAEYRFRKSALHISRPLFYSLLTIITVWIGVAYFSITTTMDIAQSNSEIETLTQKIEKNRHIKVEILQLKSSREIIRLKIRALQRISVNKEKWVRLLETFTKELPSATWISSIIEKNTDTSDVLHVQGQTFSFNDIANFMSRLSGAEYLKSVDLQFIEQRDKGNKTFEYLLDCTINQDAQLGSLPDTSYVAPVKTPLKKSGR